MKRKQHVVSANREAGLTLIEIIVVIVIIGVVVTLLTGALFNKADDAKANLNKTKLKSVQNLINQYRLQYNSLPDSLDDLTRCSEKTGEGCIPLAKEADLKDLFGTSLRYQLEEGGRRYRLTSLGADQREGGEGRDYDVNVTGP